ncbi:hypothetical protein D9M72_587720 [compost metagenome]
MRLSAGIRLEDRLGIGNRYARAMNAVGQNQAGCHDEISLAIEQPFSLGKKIAARQEIVVEKDDQIGGCRLVEDGVALCAGTLVARDDTGLQGKRADSGFVDVLRRAWADDDGVR